MKPRAVFFLITIVGALCSLCFRMLALCQTDFANGWDAYFYLVQLQAIVDQGKMHSEEWTLLYPILYVCQLFFDMVTATKIVSSLFAGVFTALVSWISYQYTQSIRITVFVIALTIFSPELTYFSAQWPKNLLGIDIVLLLIVVLMRKRVFWAVLIVMLGFFAHRLTAVLGVSVFCIWYLLQRSTLKVIGIGAVVLVLVLLGVQYVPGLLSIADYERLTDLFGTSIHIPFQAFLRLFESTKVSVFWKIELWITFITFSSVGGIVLYQLCIQKIVRPIALFFVLIFVLWFPLYQFTLAGAAYRFFHTGAVFALVLPIFILNIPSVKKNSTPILVYTLSIGIIILSTYSYRSYVPKLHDPPYALYHQITDSLVARWNTEEAPELVIAHKALAEYITYVTKVDAMPWVPEYTIAEQKLYRIGDFPFPQLTRYYLGNKVQFLSSTYGYVKETDWAFFMEAITTHESEEVTRLHLHWKNPTQVRPMYLLKNK